LLEQIQKELLTKARKHLDASKVEVENSKEAKKRIEEGRLLYVPWCESESCEENFKFELGGAKTLNAPFAQPKLKKGQKCFACDSLAKRYFYVSKSY
jgi:prolyl-tRNA synthetase